MRKGSFTYVTIYNRDIEYFQFYITSKQCFEKPFSNYMKYCNSYAQIITRIPTYNMFQSEQMNYIYIILLYYLI